MPVDTIYPVYAGDSYTPAQISARNSERARHSHENDAKMVESEAQMRTLNDRIYNVLYIRMRDTAPDTLERLGAKHAYPMSPSEIDGTAMLDEILLDAEAKLRAAQCTAARSEARVGLAGNSRPVRVEGD